MAPKNHQQVRWPVVNTRLLERFLGTFGRSLCRHRHMILRRNPTGIMGRECFRCGTWWPLKTALRSPGEQADKNAGRAIPRPVTNEASNVKLNSGQSLAGGPRAVKLREF
jgi:hypothetical protein